jgi:hypothetical protein
MPLNSKGRSLDNEQGYPREGSSQSLNSPGDRNRRKDDAEFRSNKSDADRRIRIGKREKESRNIGRGRSGESSDDSDLSDGYSRARTNDRIRADERRTDNKDTLLAPGERNDREEHFEASQRGRADDGDDDVDVSISASTALSNLFDRIVRGKSSSVDTVLV